MGIFKRHTTSNYFLGLYFLWWAFVLFYMFSASKQIKPVCDFSPLAIVVVSFFLGVIYSLGFFIASMTTPEPKKTDYLIFIGFITLPLFLGGIYLVSNA